MAFQFSSLSGTPTPSGVPDEMFMRQYICQMKAEAQDHLDKRRYGPALNIYTELMNLIMNQIPWGSPLLIEELPKALSNRSLVFAKMGDFGRALGDASTCTKEFPSWSKGHWRAAMALKGLKEEYQSLLPLVEGFNLCMSHHPEDRDTVNFMVEVVNTTIVIRDDPQEWLMMLAMPSQYPPLMIRAIQQLCRSTQWEGVSLLIQGLHAGPFSPWEGIAKDTNVQNTQVSSLVTFATKPNAKGWEQKLLIALCKNGAAVSDMEKQLNMPAIHMGVQLTLLTGQVDFLKYLFESYLTTDVQRNAKNITGNTALHHVVLTGQVNTTLGETVLRLLLNNGCKTGIKNQTGKKPIQYLGAKDAGFTLIQAAERAAVEELKKAVIGLKEEGNKAHKEQGYHSRAVDLYTRAYDICHDCDALHNEVATLLTNRSNVLSVQGKHIEALCDAENAITYDPGWYKGHWRKGQVLRVLDNCQSSFSAFITGFTVSKNISQDQRRSFLAEAVLSLASLSGDHAMYDQLYNNQLRQFPNDDWTFVLTRLSKAGEWKVIRDIVMGSERMLTMARNSGWRFEEGPKGFGVALDAPTNGMMFSTVFQFIQTHTEPYTYQWLTVLLKVLLDNGGGLPSFLTFVQDDHDTPLHAAIKYSLITGQTMLLDDVPVMPVGSVLCEIEDKRGDSIFHVITKNPQTKNMDNILRVARLMLDKGFSAKVKDRSGRTPIDYIKHGEKAALLDLLLSQYIKDSKPPIKTKQKSSNRVRPLISDVNNPQQLRELGNKEYNMGDYPAAIELYTQAIKLTPANDSTNLCKLYGNRSECHLRMNEGQKSLNDAMDSVSYDGHWYKCHLRVGKALGSLGRLDQAIKALVNAFTSLTPRDGEPIRLEVLSEFALHYARLDKYRYNELVKGLDKVSYELWAKVSYNLLCRNQNNAACVAYNQLNLNVKGLIDPSRIQVDLLPFCNLVRLETESWVLDLLQMFLVCESDHNTLSVQVGDRYIHAVVKMTLAAGVMDLLLYILQNFVVPHQEQNLLDSNGNTALHIATRASRASALLRLQVCAELLECNVNTLQKNSEGRLAVEYVPKGEGQLVGIMLESMKTDDAMTKQMRQQQQAAKANKQQEDKYQQQRVEQQKIEQQRQEKLQEQKRQEQQKLKEKKEKQRKLEQERQQKRATVNPCGNCEQNMEEAKEHLRLKRTGKAYTHLASVIRRKHKGNQHKHLTEEALILVTESLGASLNPEIPDTLAKIAVELYQGIIDKLAKMEKWRHVDILVRENRKHHGDLALRDFAKHMNVARVIRHPSFLKQDELLADIIGNMLDSGAIMENDGKMCILAAIQEEHFKLLCILFMRGANPVFMSLQPGDTPVHAAMSIALERDKGNFTILNILMDKFESDPEKFSNLDPNQQDTNGDGLFHLVGKMKYNSTSQKATELLCDRKISALVYNSEGKLPKDYLINKKNDRRLQFFRLASVETGAKAGTKKPKRSGGKGKPEDASADPELMTEDLLQYNRTDETKTVAMAEKLTRKDKKLIFAKTSTNRELTRKKIEDMIFNLPDTPYSIFNPKVPRMEEGWKSRRSGEGQKGSPSKMDIVKFDRKEEMPRVNKKIQQGEINVDVPPRQEEPAVDVAVDQGDAVEEEEEEEDVEEKETFEVDVQAFDNLEWEVECTADVWRTLRNNHVLPEFKQRIVRKVQHLASGEWRRSLCKAISFSKMPETLRLYEAKLSKGGRILWELAIAFSPRLSETAERRLNMEEEDGEDYAVRGGRIYSEVIRVWDIVFDHDHIYRSVDRIVKSHNRGEQCIIQKKLKGVKQTQFQEGAGKRYPMIYAEADVGMKEEELKEYQQQDLQRFYPPASSNDTEYHILKFYSFSSNLVHHILQNIETKVDFPFRVTDLEHAIINLKSRAPILLLGRSGTGKTTCCLYRLWTQFLSYWTKAIEADGPLLPRCAVFRQQEDAEEDAEDENNADEDEEDDGVEELLGAVVGPDGNIIEENGEEEKEGQIYDHLHQIFITKNAVLCSEVQKNFRELSHACVTAKNQVATEDQVLPPRLQDVDDFRFPLFITSKQLLLMLDASLGQPYFFERGEDGALKVDVVGWTDGEGTLSILPLLAEESDDEDDDGQFDDADDDDDGPPAANSKVKVDPRREVTYDVFSEEIWPKICKKFGGKYHPSLVWTEIMSFIKGSFEALSKPSGILQKEEYFELGKKRAPNFSGKRADIYDLFKRYDHFKKQKFLFDETDLVRSVYNRLKRETEITWVVHQVFVDETQDFTQAELCLLLRICQDPNQMFLTGDTAQSIMRGIAFRFNDLKSLFFYAKKSMHAVGQASSIEVPKRVHQLTHNYRSHAGILHLASSILDLMVRFFPESFDRLQKDQGLFNGPPPVLLESCGFSDLAMLLRGNRRKTSHIEFGAHQAILVVDEAARDNIPEELQLGLILTIYEAKGLEFDDILLYNFFKDSQAVKEWRVVTDYLEELATGVHGDDAPSHQESLVEIDDEVLQQTNRPRPLKFDASLHKVLNSELKHMYTAVTRARVNVWIFDEDQEKRAPMFEYFKARKLVKILNSLEVDDGSMENIGGMFAEESSSDDWIRRGEDFMKHALYEVAAKCFIRGGDDHLHKVALAHQQALLASRTKDSHQRMRDEFLVAAEMFLGCSLPSQATKCLQNARERELVARLFEKIGLLERAGDTYRKIKRPVEGSRCYEQLGDFNLAIETLCENEYYDMAIDALWRYSKLLESLRLKGEVVPAVLKEHAPATVRTRERLSHMAAEFHHRNNNEVRMMVNLERLENLQDRVTFLKNKGYFEKAAELLQKEGEYAEASQLYLNHGKTKEAVATARRSIYKDLVGECLIVDAQVMLRKKPVAKPTEEEARERKQEVLQTLQAAIDILLNAKIYDLRGEACLLKGEITGELTDINESWGAFNKCSPRCEAGQLECMDWMVRNSNLNDLMNLVKVVKGMDNLFGVLKALLSSNKARTDKIYKYYGLIPTSDGSLKMYPQQKPRALQIVKHRLSNSERKKTESRVPKDTARDEICRYLLEQGHYWFGEVDLALSKLKRQREQCRLFAQGLPCVVGNGTCPSRHEILTERAYYSLLEVDLLHIEMDWYVQQGCGRLLKDIAPALTDMVNVFLSDVPMARFKSCEVLLQHIMPRPYFPFRFTERSLQARKIQEFLVRKIKKDQMVCYLKAKHRYMKKEERKTSTDVFMKLYFLANYFQLRDVDASNLMMEFEMEVKQEYLNKSQPERMKRRLEPLGFLVKDLSVQCLARRFYEAYYQLTIPGDPQKALLTFTAFIKILGDRNKTVLLPEYKDFLMWIEFFTTVAICFGAKNNQVTNVFFLPASYLSLVHFIDSSFRQNGQPTFETIQRHKAWGHSSLTLSQERAERIISVLCGSGTRLNLIRQLFKVRDDRPVDFALAERLLILCLTFLCNMGKSLFTSKEADLLQNLCLIALPHDCPPRLEKAIRAVQDANGLDDIAAALKELLKDRDQENLCLCQWMPLERYGVQSSPLQNLSLIPSKFFDLQTKHRMTHPVQEKVTDEDEETAVTGQETDMTMEEEYKWKNEQKMFIENQKKEKAAFIITRYFKQIQFVKQCSILRCLVEEQIELEKSEDRLRKFKPFFISDTACTICGVEFDKPVSNLVPGQDELHSTVLGHEARPVQRVFSSLFTPVTEFFGGGGQKSTTEEATDVSESSMDQLEDGKLPEDAAEAWRAKQKSEHEQSLPHRLNMTDFMYLKKTYKTRIVVKQDEILEFIKKHDLRKEKGLKNYADMKLDLERLVYSSDMVQNEFERTLAKRDWKDPHLLMKFVQESIGFHEIVKDYVLEKWAAMQESKAEAARGAKASNNHATSAEDWDPETIQLEDVVQEPVRQREKQKGKGRGRGRGRARQRQQDD